MKIVGGISGKRYNSSQSGRKARPHTLSEAGVEITATERNVTDSISATETETNQDLTDTYEVSADGYNEFDVFATNNTFFGAEPVLSSSDESVFTIDQGGTVTRVSDGTAQVIAATEFRKKVLALTITSFGSARVLQSSGEPASGSLRKAVEEAIYNDIQGVTASDSTKKIFNGNAFNANCWASAIDWTALRQQANSRGAVAITPRHIIGVEHYKPTGTFRCIASDGAVITRTVTHGANVGPPNSSDNYVTDLYIGFLDSELPETVSPVKVAPANIADYLPTLAARDVPLIGTDQEKKATLMAISFFSSTRTVFRKLLNNSHRQSFYEPKITGDSGSPAFLWDGNQLILLTSYSFGGAGSGPPIHALHTQINAAIASADTSAGISTGYTLTSADLSGYTNYS